MKKSILTNKEKDSWWNGTLFTDDLVLIAISHAYRDFQRRNTGFAKNKARDAIYARAVAKVREWVNKIIEQDNITQDDFDMLHKEAMTEIVHAMKDDIRYKAKDDTEEKLYEGQDFCFGKAQKWINMTFKYLNLLNYKGIEKVYEYCHVPIDKYMLDITKYNKNVPSELRINAWSELDDYEVYKSYQIWFREKYNDGIPLDKEFYLWLEEAKKNSYRFQENK